MKPELKSRYAAHRMLMKVMADKRPLDTALDELRAMKLTLRDQAFAVALAMQVLRRAGEADQIIAQFLQKPLPDKLAEVHQILRLGVAQLLWMDTPPHAAIDTSVELVKHLRHQKLSGVVNAVLRRVSERKAQLCERQNGLLNAPKWMVAAWENTYGMQDARAFANAQGLEPPLDISVAGDPADWAERLGGELIWHHTVRCATGHVTEMPGFDDGKWWVQDIAATIPAWLLGDVKGRRVLDLCAAPGGKTAQLACAGAMVTALDRSQARMKRFDENMARLHLNTEKIAADILKWQPDAPFDAILLDAPCTATGTIRRHPDILYTRKEQDVIDLAGIQQAMLHRAAQWVKPGGTLVYCVCSLQKEEGEAQIPAFLEANPGWSLSPIDPTTENIPAEWVTKAGYLRTLPHYLADKGGMDGFFAARLVRQ